MKLSSQTWLSKSWETRNLADFLGSSLSNGIFYSTLYSMSNSINPKTHKYARFRQSWPVQNHSLNSSHLTRWEDKSVFWTVWRLWLELGFPGRQKIGKRYWPVIIFSATVSLVVTRSWEGWMRGPRPPGCAEPDAGLACSSAAREPACSHGPKLPGCGVGSRVSMFTRRATCTWIFGKKYFYNNMNTELWIWNTKSMKVFKDKTWRFIEIFWGWVGASVIPSD